jgi:hypothetical protein
MSFDLDELFGAVLSARALVLIDAADSVRSPTLAMT